MIQTSKSEFKAHLDAFLRKVQEGETVELCLQNIPFATLLPASKTGVNRTVLGCGRGTFRIAGDITEPAMEDNEWEMLGECDERSA